MATKNKVTIYFPDPDENELWDAIQAIPKGVRGAILRDILRKHLVGATPRIGLFLGGDPAAAGIENEAEQEREQTKEIEADEKLFSEIPLFKF